MLRGDPDAARDREEVPAVAASGPTAVQASWVLPRAGNLAAYFPQVRAPNPSRENQLQDFGPGCRRLGLRMEVHRRGARTALFIEESVERGTKWAASEPNGEPLWEPVRRNGERPAEIQPWISTTGSCLAFHGDGRRSTCRIPFTDRLARSLSRITHETSPCSALTDSNRAISSEMVMVVVGGPGQDMVWQARPDVCAMRHAQRLPLSVIRSSVPRAYLPNRPFSWLSPGVSTAPPLGAWTS